MTSCCLRTFRTPNAKRKLTFGSLGNFLADGISITANNGILSSVAGGAPFLIHNLPEQTQQLATTDRIPALR